ncbi:MAG: ATP synthase F1 subunit epsilon [Patescibacteria group bacterium]|nr:ATP synthase F1 subunit epsilon [Patescibacteria group bacterium]
MSEDSKTIQFKIVTPEKVVYSEEISQITLPTTVGQITILPGHESLVGVISLGEIYLKKKAGGEKSFLVTTEGFVEVDNDEVSIFANSADRVEEMSEKLILKAKAEAEEALKNKENISKVATVEAEARLKKELVKLKVLKKRRRG